MHDRRNDGREEREGRERGGEGRRGPEGTEFLNLEMSKVMYAEAASLTREAARELLKDAIKERLRERLGTRIAAIAKLAADELADDVEANLAIEALIASRKQARQGQDEALRRAMAQDPAEPTRDP